MLHRVEQEIHGIISVQAPGATAVIKGEEEAILAASAAAALAVAAPVVAGKRNILFSG